MDRDPDLEDSDDSSDEDYVLGCEDNLPSEEESDGEPEDDLLIDGDMAKSGRKRKSRQTNGRNKRIKGGKGRQHLTALEDDDAGRDEINQGKTKLTEDDEKKKTDSLWSDFLQDTDVYSPPKRGSNDVDLNSSAKKSIKIEPPSEAKKETMVTITQVFDFAGEEVKVTKEVPADSAVAKNNAVVGQQANNVIQPGTPFGSKVSCKPSTAGGISAILGQIGKKSKIGTLEKSKLDWERFKSSQNLDADIQVHNRGRNGFLEKQDFLQRADIRQFEIEKQLRKTTRSTR